jgi:hypothetical protein
MGTPKNYTANYKGCAIYKELQKKKKYSLSLKQYAPLAQIKYAAQQSNSSMIQYNGQVGMQYQNVQRYSNHTTALY